MARTLYNSGQRLPITEQRMIPETYEFPVRLAGNLSLDFCNSIEYRDSARCLDFLPAYDHVLGWCLNAGAVDAAEYTRLKALGDAQPASSAAAHRAALDLRNTLYRIFTAVIAEEQPSAHDLSRLNEALTERRRWVQPHGDGFMWAWQANDALTQVLSPIALSAAELLTSDQLERVRQCPNCGWLFVDTSRNHSRRWCSMDFCGSRIKSRRQYERRKQSQKP